MKKTLQLAGLLAGVVLVSLARFTPEVSYWYPAGAGYQVARVPGLVAQFQDPFAPLDFNVYTIVGNALTWRLLPPVVGGLLHLPVTAYFAAPLFATALLLGVSAAYVYRRTCSGRTTLIAALLLATSSAFFTTTGWLGNFDGLYLTALVVVAFTGSPVALGAACALGPWCDERFLLLLPATFLLRQLTQPGPLRPTVLAALAGIAPYVLLRLWAAGQNDGSLVLQLTNQQRAFDSYVGYVPVGWWMGFRLGWAAIAIGVWASLRKNPAAIRPAQLLLPFALAAGLAAIVFLAWDLSRSIAALTPFLLAGVIYWPESRLRFLGIAAFFNLLLPAAHVAESQIITIQSFWN